MTDPVNHPLHYQIGRFEVIDVIEEWQLGFHLGTPSSTLPGRGRRAIGRRTCAKQDGIWTERLRGRPSRSSRRSVSGTSRPNVSATRDFLRMGGEH
jgi:hypothetical protein